MTARATPPVRGAVLGWVAAGVVALGLHAGVALLLIRTARPEPLVVGGGDAIAVEIEPVEGEAAKPDEIPPAVPADEATTASAAAAAAAASEATPPSPKPATADPVPPQDPPPPDLTPASPVQVPSSPVATPEADAPPSPTPPSPAPALPPRPETPPVDTTQASAASAASAAAEDAASALQRLAAARETAWRGRLVAHLNRFRRFPPGVKSGTARIAFTIDPDGRVTAVSVAASSGDAALDDAAQRLVQRASPFPAPPAGVAARALSFVVPVRYDARRP